MQKSGTCITFSSLDKWGNFLLVRFVIFNKGRDSGRLLNIAQGNVIGPFCDLLFLALVLVYWARLFTLHMTKYSSLSSYLCCSVFNPSPRSNGSRSSFIIILHRSFLFYNTSSIDLWNNHRIIIVSPETRDEDHGLPKNTMRKGSSSSSAGKIAALHIISISNVFDARPGCENFCCLLRMDHHSM